MSNQLIKQFFHSKQGQGFQREICDEILGEREKLVTGNQHLKKQMEALLHDKELFKANERCILAEKELKEARECRTTILHIQHVERNRLEKEIKKNDLALLKSSPGYVTVCFESIRSYFDDSLKMDKEKSNFLNQCLKDVNNWSLKALPYDAMKGQFNKMVSTIDNIG